MGVARSGSAIRRNGGEGGRGRRRGAGGRQEPRSHHGGGGHRRSDGPTALEAPRWPRCCPQNPGTDQGRGRGGGRKGKEKGTGETGERDGGRSAGTASESHGEPRKVDRRSGKLLLTPTPLARRRGVRRGSVLSEHLRLRCFRHHSVPAL